VKIIVTRKNILIVKFQCTIQHVINKIVHLTVILNIFMVNL